MDHSNDKSNKSSYMKKEKNSYEDDAKETLHYTRMLLEILGIWPIITRETSSRVKKLISKFLMIASPIVLMFPIIPTAIHMIVREKDLIVRLIIFGPIGFLFTNFLKYGFIVLRYDTISMCVDDVKRDWAICENENDRVIMRKNANIGRHLTFICGAFMYTGGMSFHTIMPLLSGNTINEFNETVRPLVYPGFDIFFDSQSSPTYEIIFIVFCISAFVTYTVTTASCNLAAVFVSHVCGQIEIVMSRLGNLVNDIDVNDNNVELKKRITFVVMCHARIMRLSSRTEKMLREICLVEVVSSTIIICLLEYCMMDWNNTETVALITYFVLLVSLCFNLYLFCHIGELLKEQCCQVGRASYMIEWYKLPNKTGLAIVMIIAMANYPRQITAGGMMELTIYSFGGIIKTSLVYMNMLRAVAE